MSKPRNGFGDESLVVFGETSLGESCCSRWWWLPGWPGLAGGLPEVSGKRGENLIRKPFRQTLLRETFKD